MSDVRPEVVDMVREWNDELRSAMDSGLYSIRVQFKNEDGGLAGTLFYNAKGGFVVHPGEAPVPVDEWLASHGGGE